MIHRGTTWKKTITGTGRPATVGVVKDESKKVKVLCDLSVFTP